MYKLTRSLSTNKGLTLHQSFQYQRMTNNKLNQNKNTNSKAIHKNKNQTLNDNQKNYDTLQTSPNTNVGYLQTAKNKLNFLSLKSSQNQQYRSSLLNSPIGVSPKSPSIFYQKNNKNKDSQLQKISSICSSVFNQKYSNKKHQDIPSLQLSQNYQKKYKIQTEAEQSCKKAISIPRNSYLNLQQQRQSKFIPKTQFLNNNCHSFGKDSQKYIQKQKQKQNELQKTIQKQYCRNTSTSSINNFNDTKFFHLNSKMIQTPKLEKQSQKHQANLNSKQLEKKLQSQNEKCKIEQQMKCKIYKEQPFQQNYQCQFILQCEELYGISFANSQTANNHEMQFNKNSKNNKKNDILTNLNLYNISKNTQERTVQQIFQQVNKRDQIYSILQKQGIFKEQNDNKIQQNKDGKMYNPTVNKKQLRVRQIQTFYNQGQIMQQIIEQFLKLSGLQPNGSNHSSFRSQCEQYKTSNSIKTGSYNIHKQKNSQYHQIQGQQFEQWQNQQNDKQKQLSNNRNRNNNSQKQCYELQYLTSLYDYLKQSQLTQG